MSRATEAKPTGKQSRYYLQLSFSARRTHRMQYWYWDGKELIPKDFMHPKKRAKVYDSKANALAAAKKLQKRVERFADQIKDPIVARLPLKPVRVTW